MNMWELKYTDKHTTLEIGGYMVGDLADNAAYSFSDENVLEETVRLYERMVAVLNRELPYGKPRVRKAKSTYTTVVG